MFNELCFVLCFLCPNGHKLKASLPSLLHHRQHWSHLIHYPEIALLDTLFFSRCKYKRVYKNPSINTTPWLQIYGHCRQNQVCPESHTQPDIKIQGIAECNTTWEVTTGFFHCAGQVAFASLSSFTGVQLIQFFLSFTKRPSTGLTVSVYKWGLLGNMNSVRCIS